MTNPAVKSCRFIMQCRCFVGGIILSVFSPFSLAGYGIECEAPTDTSGFINQPLPFTFTCENKTTATFSSFKLSANQVSPVLGDEGSVVASITFNIVWPNGGSNIKPGDVGTVTGTVNLPQGGLFAFDFDKAYGGETFKGIFCGNGKDLKHCMKTASSELAAVSDVLGNFVTGMCPVDLSTGLLSDCAETISGSVYRPRGLAFAVVAGQSYLYVANENGNSVGSAVSLCSVDATGSISNSCTPLTVGGDANTSWVGIDFYPSVIEPQWAYVSYDEFGAGGIWQCPIESNGTFGTCMPTGPAFAGPGSPTVQNFNGIPYLYVPDGNFVRSNAQIWQCRIDPATGHLSATCQGLGATTPFDSAYDIAFATVTSGTYGYVADWFGAYVSRCAIDTSTGQLDDSSCVQVLTAPTVEQPLGIKIKTLPFSGLLEAYIVDGFLGVHQCSVDSSGNLNNCVLFTNNNSFQQAFEIDFWPPF